MTPMYGPAVRCKRTSSCWRMCGLSSMYPAFDWSLLRSGPSWISARVRSAYGVAGFAPSAHGLKDDFHRGRSCLSELNIAGRLSVYSLPLGLQKAFRVLHLTDHLFDFCD